jgi:hypothetical protein
VRELEEETLAGVVTFGVELPATEDIRQSVLLGYLRFRPICSYIPSKSFAEVHGI